MRRTVYTSLARGFTFFCDLPRKQDAAYRLTLTAILSSCINVYGPTLSTVWRSMSHCRRVVCTVHTVFCAHCDYALWPWESAVPVAGDRGLSAREVSQSHRPDSARCGSAHRAATARAYGNCEGTRAGDAHVEPTLARQRDRRRPHAGPPHTQPHKLVSTTQTNNDATHNVSEVHRQQPAGTAPAPHTRGDR